MTLKTQYPSFVYHIAKLLLVVGLWMGCSEKVLSQDWKLDYGFEIYFGANAEDQGQAVIQTDDKGYLMVGWSEDPISIGGDNDIDIYVVRVDVDGDLVWEQRFDKGFIENGYDVVQTADGGFLIVGDIKEFPTAASKFQACLLKIDAAGNEEWFKTYSEGGTDRGISLIATADGGFLFTGRTDNGETTDEDILLVKTDGDGNLVWSKSYANAGNDAANSLIEMADGYAIIGTVENTANGSKDFYLLKTDFIGTQQWAKFYGTNDFDEGYDLLITQDNQLAMVGSYGSTSDVALIKADLDGNQLWDFTFGDVLGDNAFDFLQNEAGEFVIAGITEIDATNIDILLANVSEDGQTLNWQSKIGRNTHVDWGQALTSTSDGGYAVVGYNSEGVSLFGNDLTLIKTNSSGSIFSNKIQGKVFADDDNNCDFDFGEIGLEDWLIKAESAAVTFFGTTDVNGDYKINVDTGSYELSVLVNNEYWMPCVDIYNLNFTTNYDTLMRNFPMTAMVDCPFLEVHVAAPVTQNCSNVGYQITYCNDGTIGADSAWIEVVLDGNMTFNSATLPLFSQMDSLLVFHLDTIQIGACDTLAISVATDCDVEDGITYTLAAYIYPDTICLPTQDWDESFIKVNGYCDADSIRFEIENTGNGDMNAPLNFIIIEDIVMALEESYQLNSTQKQEIVVPSTGGTYRLIAEQSPNHPGNSYPTIAVEGCDNGMGNITTGTVTIFQEDENNSSVSIDVQEATDLITNISLRGYPKGYPVDGQNLIPANTALEYHILFQNTGLDTATRVVIRDTISQTLDISTIRPGASSHSYDFNVYDNGILKFTFDNIELLPDGSEDGYGFVTFKIDQKPGNPEGTEIKNTAEIFMGYSAPMESATTVHHIGGGMIRDFIIIDVAQVFIPEVSVNAYPNPFIEGTVIEVAGENYKELILTVYDLNGRFIREEKTSGHKIEFPRKDLIQGMYVFKLLGDGVHIASGKLILK